MLLRDPAALLKAQAGVAGHGPGVAVGDVQDKIGVAALGHALPQKAGGDALAAKAVLYGDELQISRRRGIVQGLFKLLPEDQGPQEAGEQPQMFSQGLGLNLGGPAVVIGDSQDPCNLPAVGLPRPFGR